MDRTCICVRDTKGTANARRPSLAAVALLPTMLVKISYADVLSCINKDRIGQKAEPLCSPTASARKKFLNRHHVVAHLAGTPILYLSNVLW